MLSVMMARPFVLAYAVIEWRNANIRIRDGSRINGTMNPTAKANPSVTPTINPTSGGVTGGNLQAGVYYLKYTFVVASPAGETLPSTESASFTVSAGNIPTVTLPALPGGVTSINIYLTAANGASNSETLYLTGVTTTTQVLQNPYVAGGVAPPVLNTTGSYAIGVTSVAVAGLSTVLTNGFQFTVGGDSTIYKILSHAETLGVTTSITLTPGLVAAAASGSSITFGPHVLLVKVGDGNLTYTEKRPLTYIKDRGRLDTVKLGDEEPVDLKLETQWQFITAVSGSGTPTIEDALKNIGEASNWVTSATDPCEPYAVDLEIEYTPPCPSVQREVISFPTFRYEDLMHDIKQAQISISGKANVTNATSVRAA